MADEVVVPRAVADEIHAGPEDDLTRQFLNSGQLPVVDTPFAKLPLVHPTLTHLSSINMTNFTKTLMSMLQ